MYEQLPCAFERKYGHLQTEETSLVKHGKQASVNSVFFDFNIDL